jgi:RNA polymerase sigma-70 factor (ECF subfamily)
MTFEAARSFMLMTERMSPDEAQGGGAADPLSRLVARARAGEREAFEQVMDCTQRRVAATAWRLLGNREDARDATQESYLRAYKYLKGFREGEDFQGWLYRITVNVCRDMLRARGRAGSESVSLDLLDDGAFAAHAAAPAPQPDTEQAALVAQQRAIVGRALSTLPEKERTAIVLRDLEGHTTEEVARLMNTRPATVRSQVSTARTKIKLFYERLLRDGRAGGDAR